MLFLTSAVMPALLPTQGWCSPPVTTSSFDSEKKAEREKPSFHCASTSGQGNVSRAGGGVSWATEGKESRKEERGKGERKEEKGKEVGRERGLQADPKYPDCWKAVARSC
jgi:hypothetical protein